MEAGASTVPLMKAPVVVPKPPGSGTAPMAKTGGPTQNLPKATVQLAKSPGTQTLNRPPAVAAAAAPRQDTGPLEEERDPETGLAPLAVVCTFLALALMALNLFGTDKWFSAPEGTSLFMVPEPPNASWEKANDDGSGTYTSNFQSMLKDASKNFD